MEKNILAEQKEGLQLLLGGEMSPCSELNVLNCLL